jgi:hypothetical protein
VVPPVERRRTFVQDATGQAVDVRRDDVERTPGREDAPDLGEHPPRLVQVLEHGVESDDVE